MGTRLSALVVNYNTGSFALRCAESLRADWQLEGRAAEDLEIVVVDNASPVDQEPWLTQLEDAGVQVIRSETNGGYAAGMNMALAHTSGQPDDVVAILNPDLFFLPGSVGTLLEFVLANPKCGAVDPRASIDHSGELNLPRNLLPTLGDHTWSILAQFSPAISRGYSARRLKSALPWWSADGPIEADMLSGCCVFLRRAVVAELPSLMDERYPLYYEDTDLFRELHRIGYRTYHHGGARVLHHWSRSIGVGDTFSGESERRYKISQRKYFKKFYGALGGLVIGTLNRLSAWWPEAKSFRPMHELQHLGDFADPVEIPVGAEGDFVLELSMAPTWILAVGILGHGSKWVCPAETWDWFFEAEYFMRALDTKTGAFLGAWSFRKTTSGRVDPLELDAIPEYAALAVQPVEQVPATEATRAVDGEAQAKASSGARGAEREGDSAQIEVHGEEGG